MTEEKQICKKCGEEKPINKFDLYKGYRRHTCRECHDQGRDPVKLIESTKRKMARRNIKRANGLTRVADIIHDTKKSDRKKGRENNLTKEIVENLLSIGKCSYCENTKIMLTLDRIDNNIGHTIENVVVACARCNQIKSSMPYEAWTILIPAVKEAVKNGSFGTWIGGRHQHKK